MNKIFFFAMIGLSAVAFSSQGFSLKNFFSQKKKKKINYPEESVYSQEKEKPCSKCQDIGPFNTNKNKK